MDNNVNARIREMRKKRGYTQAELGERVGLKCSTYSQMERNGKISVEMAIKLADVLEVERDYITYGKSPSKELKFTHTEQTILPANDTQSFLNQIKNGEEQLILSVKEKNIIKNFRSLSEADKKEILALIKSKIK